MSLDEIAEIKSRVDIEIEVFVHGAMCVSYSGRCLLSHYMVGRSGNRGECAHPCRYSYRLLEEKRPGEFFPIHEDEKGSYILNSRDLCLIEYLPQLMERGIDAFKIEGRMKAPYGPAPPPSTAVPLTVMSLKGEYSGGTGYPMRNWQHRYPSFTNGFIEVNFLCCRINKEIPPGKMDFMGGKRLSPDTGMLEIEQEPLRFR